MMITGCIIFYKYIYKVFSKKKPRGLLVTDQCISTKSVMYQSIKWLKELYRFFLLLLENRAGLALRIYIPLHNKEN